jgi:uncharacterized OB-fold protein
MVTPVTEPDDMPAPPPARGRIQPATSADTEFFWQGVREHRLLIQQCVNCGAFRHPPGPACPDCASFEWTAYPASGHGRIYTYMVHHYPVAAPFTGPNLVAVVELDEGVRLVTNVVEAPFDAITIGTEVEVCFVDQEEGWTVPQFRLVDAATSAGASALAKG